MTPEELASALVTECFKSQAGAPSAAHFQKFFGYLEARIAHVFGGMAELESQNERLEREARGAGKDIALAEAKKRIAELEAERETWGNEFAAVCALKEQLRDSTERVSVQSEVIRLLLSAVDCLEGFSGVRDSEATEAREILSRQNSSHLPKCRDVSGGPSWLCDPACTAFKKDTQQEISIGSDLGASRKTDRPDGPSTYRPDDTELMGKGSAKAGPDSSQSEKVSEK